MDETWIHHYTPVIRRPSAEWTAAGESRPKRPKTQQWAGKFMASVFWDAHGIFFIDYLEKGKKCAVPPRQCTVPQVHKNDDQFE